MVLRVPQPCGSGLREPTEERAVQSAKSSARLPLSLVFDPETLPPNPDPAVRPDVRPLPFLSAPLSKGRTVDQHDNKQPPAASPLVPGERARPFSYQPSQRRENRRYRRRPYDPT
ncbi:hypothetical protein B0T18DRAFT_392011 [Schizothecium vesticola]|uniref:Uncharacterized protein n=1 Tax=Schizothecium vesticola TaxID=314040 RepID=A0AA40K249_9PEZI|nr:hypothetical protein B0T18DRAFT_392011 [Schizothecium vesticola]